MIPRVSLVSVGIFDFAEMRGFSSSGLYLREIAQRMHSSVSRYFVNGVRIREKNFSVLRLLQNMPAATCQVKCNSKLEKISEGEFQLRHLRGR